MKAFLEERLAFAVAQGIREERVCLDPGIGFGKTVEHNFELVRRLDELAALGRPVVIGFSRKSSLGRILGDPTATTGSTAASVGAAVAAYERGATILRVHDVREHVEALRARAGGASGLPMIDRARTASSCFGYHGVLEEEQRERASGSVYDIELEVGERGAADRIEDAVDYRDVVATRCARSPTAALRAARGARDRDRGRRSLERFPVERVQVRVRKPEVRPAGVELEYAAVTADGRDAARDSGRA